MEEDPMVNKLRGKKINIKANKAVNAKVLCLDALYEFHMH
jgi:hypothetical protein